MPEYMYACDIECLSEGDGLVPFGGESEWVAKECSFLLSHTLYVRLVDLYSDGWNIQLTIITTIPKGLSKAKL